MICFGELSLWRRPDLATHTTNTYGIVLSKLRSASLSQRMQLLARYLRKGRYTQWQCATYTGQINA